MTQEFNLFNMLDLVSETDTKKQQEKEEKIAIEKAEKEALAAEQKSEREAKLAEINLQKAETKDKETKKTPEKSKVDEFKPNESTVIRYYGESFEITAYFSAEELAEGVLVNKANSEPERQPLTAELLRKRMEKDFPELVKEYTEIIFLKAKNLIIPTMKAKKKGNCGVLSNDSTFPFPKIPFSILNSFLSISKLYGELDLEVHGDIYFNKDTKEFFLDIPKQKVNKYWVEVTEDSHDIVERVFDSIKVLEIHSHHFMPPVPSSQDNLSERVPGMHYAIVGYTRKYFPELTVREFVSESFGHRTKNIEDVFESPFLNLPSFNTRMIEVSN